ncbi:MAG: CoA transferase, partial [Dehalococcoidia bacterium]|nr:CoA transferase [Dehalococcoidia bacterium]
GDPLETEAPYFRDTNVSIQAAYYNSGKRILALDLTSDEDRQRFLDLAAAADILLEDWPAADPPLSAEMLQRAAPGLVRVSVTPVGLGAPHQLLATDLIANALSGSAAVTGAPGTPPLTGWGNQTHHTVGLYAAICALASLRVARATGRSQHVDLSAHEALISCTEQLLMEWFFPGVWGAAQTKAPRQGALHWTGAYDVFPGKNGQGAMVSLVLRFMDAILPWLVEDGAAQELDNKERFPDIIAVVKNFPYAMQVTREWVATKDPVDLFFEAQRRNLSWGVVLDVPGAVRTPQVAAREWFQDVDVPGVGPVPMPGRAIRTDADAGHPQPPRRIEIHDLSWEPRPAAKAEVEGVTPSLPLTGVRVADFTHVLAGPFGTRVLADLGADVIKIGTSLRAGGANSPNHPYYVCWNRNKRSINISMSTEKGRQLARRLAGESDVIIENFKAGVLARWGLDRASLADDYPGVSVISMNGMGKTGPWKDFLTYAPTIHALVGLTYLTNPPGRHDLGYGFSLTDHLSGLAGALATVEAVEHRQRTGRGLDIDLSQYELGLAIMGPTHIDHLVNGTLHEPIGNRHPFGMFAPHGIYRAKGDDHWVAIAVRGDEQFRAFCDVMERPELVSDPRFATHDARLANQDELDRVIEDWTKGCDRYEVMGRCQARGVAAGAVQDAEDLTRRDENLAALRFFGTATPVGNWGEYPVDRFPAHFNGERPPHYEGVHQLGEDTFDVLSVVLGLSDDEIAELMAEGVLS